MPATRKQAVKQAKPVIGQLYAIAVQKVPKDLDAAVGSPVFTEDASNVAVGVMLRIVGTTAIILLWRPTRLPPQARRLLFRCDLYQVLREECRYSRLMRDRLMWLLQPVSEQTS